MERPSIRSSHPEVFVSHANAQLTPAGRLRLAQLVVDQGWPLRRAAERLELLGDHRQAVGRPLPRRRVAAGMVDRSSRPGPAPASHPDAAWSGAWSGCGSPGAGGRPGSPTGSGMQPSTVHKILRRYGCPPLAWTDPATGVRIKCATTPGRQLRPRRPRRPGPRRHQEARPDPRRRRPASPRPQPPAREEPGARHGLLVHPQRRRRLLPAGLQRAARRRAQGDRGRVLDARQRLLRRRRRSPCSGC